MMKLLLIINKCVNSLRMHIAQFIFVCTEYSMIQCKEIIVKKICLYRLVEKLLTL